MIMKINIRNKIRLAVVGFVAVVMCSLTLGMAVPVAEAAAVTADSGQTRVTGDIRSAYRLGNSIHYEEDDGVWYSLNASDLTGHSFTVGNITWYRDAAGAWYRHGTLEPFIPSEDVRIEYANNQTIVTGDIGAAFRLGDTVYYKDQDDVWHGLMAPATGGYTITVGNLSWYRDASGVWHRHALLNTN